MSDVNVYVQFSEELQRAQSGDVSLLDEEDGLLVRFGLICDEMLQSPSLSLGFNSAELEAWSLERNTWQLVQALYAERLTELREDSPSPQGSTSKNPYTPPQSVVQKIIGASKDLSELNAIRDWLHSIPTSLNPAEIRRGYLTYTKNKLKQANRTGAPTPRGLVDELDPDAVRRGHNVALDADDASYERALTRSLFEYVRAGELDLAVDMCRQSDQSWRAASLSGGKLWSDPTLAPEDEEGLSLDEMDTAELDEKRAKGTLRRRLWKKMCRALAKAGTDVDPYERALYGSISGDVDSVLPVCISWEDHAWAHINALFESHVEVELWTAPDGQYWTRGDALVDAEDALFWPAGQRRGVRAELEAIFERMQGGKKELQEQSGDPFHVAQKSLILGKIKDLLDTFVRQTRTHSEDLAPETLSRLLRFYAHLVLVLRLLKQPLPSESSNAILEAYVKVLEANNQPESLIAFYAATLEEQSAVDSYAHFLATFGIDSDVENRRAALLQAREHGLDLASIAFRTVEIILDDTLSTTPDLASPHSVFDAYATLDSHQLLLIRSLEWLTFDGSTYGAALQQANALVRHFLSRDLPHAARELLRQLPADLVPSLATPFDGEPASDREMRETLIREANKVELVGFRDGIETLVDDLYAAAIELLESKWLKFEPLEFADEDGLANELQRTREQRVIRQQLIPHLILRLHRTLLDTASLLPSNLARALDLANVVADERHEHYREFVSAEENRVGDYLGQVREAALMALEGEGRDPFVVGGR
ncbi:hypothetical protein RQP46_011106 [Phenoliferia psychrophenolica]